MLILSELVPCDIDFPHQLLLVFACCGVIATALAQIFTNTYQKSLDCNALQLLYHTSPIIAVVSLLSDTTVLSLF
jgi:hypothetical protein